MADWLGHRADVVADFRRFYGIDLPVEDDGEVEDLPRMALLWAALPRESRCVQRLVPEARWSPGDYLLASIEHSARVAVWQRTKDGSRGRNVPRPVQTPAERARNEARRDEALAAREEIDRILGMGG